MWYCTPQSSDLKAARKDTILVKYANDTTLIFPDQTAVSLAYEFKNIQQWARQNTLKINISKTKEITFHRFSPHKHLLAAPLLDIEQVCKLLGMIIISSSLSVRDQSTSLFV